MAHVARNPVEENNLRSEEHTSELQSRLHLVCRLLLEKKTRTRTIRGAGAAQHAFPGRTAGGNTRGPGSDVYPTRGRRRRAAAPDESAGRPAAPSPAAD